MKWRTRLAEQNICRRKGSRRIIVKLDLGNKLRDLDKVDGNQLMTAVRDLLIRMIVVATRNYVLTRFVVTCIDCKNKLFMTVRSIGVS